MTPAPDDTPPHSWLDLVAQLRAEKEKRCPDWAWTPILALSRRQAESEWQEMCEETGPEVDSLVRKFVETGEVSFPSDKLEFLFMVRLQAAARFAAMHVFMRKSLMRSPFTPMTGTRAEVLSILLIDWWWGVGMSLTFHEAWALNLNTEKNKRDGGP